MTQYVISYDLGTGGLKAGLYDINGKLVSFDFHPYETTYPKSNWHEQRPEDWWQAVCVTTKNLLKTTGINLSSIAAIGSSGQSLVAAPIGYHGELLLPSIPIWSDRRAKVQAEAFFDRVDYKNWYMTTGNGDPPETYSVFKLMWMKEHDLVVFAKTKVVLGSKDYINYRLSGQIATDYSYASGSGIFDLKRWDYSDSYINAAGIQRCLFVEPIDSHAIVGTVTATAAEQCGLLEGTRVICGGVDNSCMALGTTGIGNGRVYTSLGSSAWIAVSADKPILDAKKLPFVFAHVEKGFYTTGVSIFSAGNAYKWARDTFCSDLSGNQFDQMSLLASHSPVGANGVMFNPSLAGGSSQEPSEALQGAFFGLKLSNDRGDILRSILEGVALSLNNCLTIIDPLVNNYTMVISGGGAKSDLWMQIFSDVYKRKIVITDVDQDAASLGAAAIALRGAGFWQDYSHLDELFNVRKTFVPILANSTRYRMISEWFTEWIKALAIIHDKMLSRQ